MGKKIALITAVFAVLQLGWLIEGIPYNIDVTAKIYPAQKWVLLKDTDGSLVSTLYNYRNGTVSNVRSYKLDNGDVAYIDFVPATISGINFNKGDTIALLRSALTDERIALVKSQLEELQAYLRVDETGGKVAEVAQAREQLRFAEKQLEMETRNYNRALQLYQQNVIAQMEFNLQEASYEQAKAQVGITRKTLEAINTGSKPEQIRYTKARIRTVDMELQSLMRLKSSHTLITPIGGKAEFNISPEEVISIEDTAVYVLHFPIRLKDKRYISSFSKLLITQPFAAVPLQGTLTDVSDKVEYMAGDQIVFAKAVLAVRSPELSTGMFLRCRLECDRISLYEYVRRVLSQSFY